MVKGINEIEDKINKFDHNPFLNYGWLLYRRNTTASVVEIRKLVIQHTVLYTEMSKSKNILFQYILYPIVVTVISRESELSKQISNSAKNSFYLHNNKVLSKWINTFFYQSSWSVDEA